MLLNARETSAAVGFKDPRVAKSLPIPRKKIRGRWRWDASDVEQFKRADRYQPRGTGAALPLARAESSRTALERWARAGNALAKAEMLKVF